ncbi:MAG: hypothetical protein QOI83_2870 [Streptomycetaceae bacterium]|nr:hypothetical protein [Streptomycetaceae bacterium]
MGNPWLPGGMQRYAESGQVLASYTSRTSAEPGGAGLEVAAFGDAHRPAGGREVGGAGRSVLPRRFQQVSADRVQAVVPGQPAVGVQCPEQFQPGARWRWIGLNQGNAALTVIRYAPGRPPAVLVHNDTRHLPAELRWTGFPPEYRV